MREDPLRAVGENFVMSASRITCALAAIVLCVQAAHADLLIGDFRESDGVGPVPN
jgi:hypothetical protein